jgi:hypothetical protein
MKGPYLCLECEGSGEGECLHCGSMVDCDDCDGTGLDNSRMDVAAFTAAEGEILNTGVSTWSWIENGICLGRRSDSGITLAHADFARRP